MPPEAGASIEVIGTDVPDRWCAALSTVPHAWWHTHRAAKAWEAGSDRPMSLFAFRDTSGVAACVYATRVAGDADDLYVPAGFGGCVVRGDAARAGRAFRDHVRALGHVAGYFPLHPTTAAPDAHDGVRATGNTLFLVDLRDGADAVLARSDRSVRRSLRAFARAGRRIDTERSHLAGFVMSHYDAFMRAAGANPAAIWPVPMLETLLADPAVLVGGVADDAGICAVYAFGTTPHVGDALLNVSVRNGREHTAALVAWGIAELAARGVPWLHLGGSVVAGDAIAGAKRKFRPVEVPMLAACEVYRPDAFAALCAAAGVPPDAPNCYFPPYRARPTAPGPEFS